MDKTKKVVLSAVYSAGALIAAILFILTIAGPNFVLFPDAMLPMDLRELALAWLAIGFLPMLLASTHFYKVTQRKAVFLPAVMCLLALLFWLGTWTVGIFHSPALASGGDIALPEAEAIESVHFTGEGIDLTFKDNDFITQFLHGLSQAENTGRASVSDEPQKDTGAILVELYFRQGGASKLFLYRDKVGFMAEQPYQGIFQVDDALEDWLWERLTPGADGVETHV